MNFSSRSVLPPEIYRRNASRSLEKESEKNKGTVWWRKREKIEKFNIERVEKFGGKTKVLSG